MLPSRCASLALGNPGTRIANVNVRQLNKITETAGSHLGLPDGSCATSSSTHGKDPGSIGNGGRSSGNNRAQPYSSGTPAPTRSPTSTRNASR